MPRYFFDISNSEPYLDLIGEDCHDDKEAWKIAKRLARDIEDTLEPNARWDVKVKDPEGHPVYSIEIIGRKL
jgi:hypothetical protein